MKLAAHWFLALLIGALILVGVMWTCSNIEVYDEYRRLEGVAVKVAARVTRVVENYDEEKPDLLFITYEYGGVTYSDVRYGFSTRKNMLGKTVRIEIDPANPTSRLPEDPGFRLPLIACMLIAPVGYAALKELSTARAKRAAAKRWPERYAGGVISSDAAREDILLELRKKRAAGLVMALILLAATAAGCAVFMAVRGTATVFLGFMPPAVLIFVGMLLFNRVGDVQVEIRETEFHRVVETKTSNGGKRRRQHMTGLGLVDLASCTLVSLQGREWATAGVEGVAFYAAVVGKRPLRFYSKEEFRAERI